MMDPVDIHLTSCVGRTVGSCVMCRGAEQLIVCISARWLTAMCLSV